MAVFTLTGGIDKFTGVAGENNFFNFTPSTLQATDTITGGAAGGFIDTLQLTAGGTVTAGQFAQVTNVERLDLNSAGNVIALTSALVAQSITGNFTVTEAAATIRSTAVALPVARPSLSISGPVIDT